MMEAMMSRAIFPQSIELTGSAVEISVRSLKKPFAISRSAIDRVHTVVTTLTGRGVADFDGNTGSGRGESRPYPRYGETVDGTLEVIRSFLSGHKGDLSYADISKLPPGAARNSIDCAFWDLASKVSDIPIASCKEISGDRCRDYIDTFFTLGLDTPEAMGEEALRMAKDGVRLIKVKLGGSPDDLHPDIERLSHVHKASPESKIIIDANEGWDKESLLRIAEYCERFNIIMIEQPLPAGQDSILKDLSLPVPVFADESVHSCRDLPSVATLYDGINIKLDKTGGLTEALRLLQQARESGLKIMTGCMVAGSLAIAPAFFLAQRADIADLDGAVFPDTDDENGLVYDNGRVYMPSRKLWG